MHDHYVTPSYSYHTAKTNDGEYIAYINDQGQYFNVIRLRDYPTDEQWEALVQVIELIRPMPSFTSEHIFQDWLNKN